MALLVDQTVLCFLSNHLLAACEPDGLQGEYGRNLGNRPPGDVARIAEFFNDAATWLNRPASLLALPTEDDDLDQAVYLICCHSVPLDRSRPAKSSIRDLFSFHYDLDTGKPPANGDLLPDSKCFAVPS